MTVRHDPSDIIGRIYDAAFESAYWSDLLCDIADLCGAENAALVVSDSRVNHSSVITPRADPGVVSAYSDFWWQHDPTAPATARHAPGRVTSLEDTGREAFFKSAFFNEFWRFSGLGAERLATNLIVGDDAFSCIVLQASNRRDEISEETRGMFSLVAPHLVRAVEVNCRLNRLELRNSVAREGHASDQAGAIVVDAQMRLVFADGIAEELLRSGSAIGTSGGRLNLRDQRADARLRGAVAACSDVTTDTPPGERIQARRRDHQTPVTIDVLPYRAHTDMLCGAMPVAMLLVTDPERSRNMTIGRLRERFGLTRAEAVLSLEMMKGDGRAAAARRCGISINTARTHLTRIFEKTGVSRQAELIRVIMDAGKFDQDSSS